MTTAIEPPLLTADRPGIGGRIKTRPEDFEVEEIPAYRPCGNGEHLFLWIEKVGLGAEFFLRQIARRLAIAASEVGSAGLKDRHAVTRQWVSVPARCEPLLPRLDGDGIRVLDVNRHTNKLRAGHLHGNRFRIRIRETDSSRGEDLTAIVARLRHDGLPNYYGPQRFGRDQQTLTLGWSLLRGQQELTQVRQRFLRKLALSAVQSALFNAYLGRRLTDGLLRTVLLGDVMAKRPAGGMFVAETVSVEQQRFDQGEIVPTGPIFGRKMFPAQGVAAEREAVILAESGLSPTAFHGFGSLLLGTRRPILVALDDLTVEWQPDSVLVTVSLPAGAYATVLLRELMKTPLHDPDHASDEAASE